MNSPTQTSAPVFTPAIARVLATVSVAFVVTQLDVTIVNIALPSISAQLHAPVSGLQWIVDAYTLAFAVLMLSAGVLGDRFGPRRLFAAGIALFAFASLACGLAPNTAALVAARALQGVSAAAMLPNSLALLNRACSHDPRLRARAVGLWTASGAISIAAGPVVGGMLIAAFGWRSIFLVNLPICLAGLAATFAWVPDGHDRSAPKQPGSPMGIDLPGQCIAIVALTAFTGAVIELHPAGIGNPFVVGSFVLAGLATLAFVAVEAKSAAPMLPLSLLRDTTFSAAVLFGVCMNLAYYGTVFVLSLYLQRVRGDTALQAGLAFLPLTGGFLLSNIASGWVVARYGPRVPMMVGAAVGALGYGLLHATQATTPIALLIVPFLLIPSGMGLAVPAMTTAILASVEPKRAGTASALLNTARQAGGAVGVAAFGALASGAGAAAVVGGLRTSAAIATALLVVGVLLGSLIHPRSHARQGARGTAPAGSAGSR
ncbi:MFS transporter [Trinickia fusca]|uniref:MFS transporter n=1 Tax=Trinickia fusca TaxID=2419777 RepID=A0A494WZ70_9BURK|nr:MFS transporter [Trinickia fusca]RKP43828.1 MFS transporter [Trinickia fusca]